MRDHDPDSVAGPSGAFDPGATATEPAVAPPDPTTEEKDRLLDLLERWEQRYRSGEEATPESLYGAGHPLLEQLRELIGRQKRLYAHLGLAKTPEDGVGEAGQPSPSFPDHEILAEIGRGGMGVVYKARDTKLDRIVAIKTIAGGKHAAAEQLERFRAESLAVARLRHPNIIAIHSVGEHEDRPYLSLEFAAGGSVAQRLAKKPMAPREAAELLETLARAIHAAHLAGVVHRDLKPSNVLLTAQGIPKVADFGLAKLLDSDAGRTLSGQIVGTPSYMAPEQAEGHSKRVGPSADIYALGAILYHALTGRPPFLGESALETIQMVTSTAVVSPRQLRPDVPRDLDTICLKCLEKEPLKRYSSALSLADDLRRFLDGRPIAARPVGPAERLWRWGRRNPKVAGLSAAVFISLVLGIVASSALAVRAIRAEAATRNQRDRAEAVINFLKKDLFGQVSVDRQAVLGARPDPELKVRTVLDRAAEKIGERFADQPLVEASIRQMLGDSYLELGLLAEAKPHLERAHDLRRTILGPDDPETFSAMASVGGWLAGADRIAEALERLVPAMEGLRKTRGRDDPEMLNTMLGVAELYKRMGNDEASALLSEAIDGFRRIEGPRGENTLNATESLAEFHVARKRPEEAERLMGASVRGLTDELGSGHPATLLATRCLAIIYGKTGRTAEAERLWRQALQGQKQALGAVHPQTLVTMVLFGEFLISQNQAREAEGLFREALEGGRKALDRNHAATILALGYLASLHVAKRELDEAEKCMIEAAAITRSRFGLDSGLTAEANFDAGMLLLIEGKYAGAEPYLRDCVTYWAKNHPEREDRWRSELRLGVCLLAQKQNAEAFSRLLSFYNAMKPAGKGESIQSEEHLGALVVQITQLRDKNGQPLEDISLARLRQDPVIRGIVIDLIFLGDVF